MNSFAFFLSFFFSLILLVNITFMLRDKSKQLNKPRKSFHEDRAWNVDATRLSFLSINLRTAELHRACNYNPYNRTGQAVCKFYSLTVKIDW